MTLLLDSTKRNLKMNILSRDNRFYQKSAQSHWRPLHSSSNKENSLIQLLRDGTPPYSSFIPIIIFRCPEQS